MVHSFWHHDKLCAYWQLKDNWASSVNSIASAWKALEPLNPASTTNNSNSDNNTQSILWTWCVHNDISASQFYCTVCTREKNAHTKKSVAREEKNKILCLISDFTDCHRVTFNLSRCSKFRLFVLSHLVLAQICHCFFLCWNGQRKIALSRSFCSEEIWTTKDQENKNYSN